MKSKRGRPRGERYALLMGGLWKNPKIRRLSNEALGVLTRAWSYAASEMTDGRVPVEMLEMWAKPKRWPAIRAELTARHPTSDGCRGEPLLAIDNGAMDARCHDFTEVNISAAEWERRLESDRKRKGQRVDYPTGNPTGNPTAFQSDALDEDEDEEISSLRSEPCARDGNRSESSAETPTQAHPTPLHGLGMRVADPSIAGLVQLWADAYASRRKAAGSVWLGRSQIAAIVRGAPMPAHRGQADALEALAQWLAEQPEAERALVVDRVLDGAFADSWMRSATWPLVRIAAEPGRWLSARRSGRVEPLPAEAYVGTTEAEIDALFGPRNEAAIAAIGRRRVV